MTGSEVIKELLVAIGYDYDERGEKKIIASVDKMTKGFVALNATVTAATIGVVAGLERMAKSFEQMYFTSARTGASVKEINSFKFAVEQMGGSASEAEGLIKNLAEQMRRNPGWKGMFKGLGARDSDMSDPVKILNAIGPKLAEMPMSVAESYASAVGMSDTMLLIIRQYSELQRRQQENQKKYGVLGFDPQKAADDGHRLMNMFRDLNDTVAKIGEGAASKVFRDMEPILKGLNDWLLKNGEQLAGILASMADGFLKMAAALIQAIPEIDAFVKNTLGPNGWNVALAAFATVIAVRLVPGLTSLMGLLTGLTALSPPAWLLAILGVGSYAAFHAATDPYVSHPGENNTVPGRGIIGMRKVQEDRNEQAGGPVGTIKRAWAGRPTWMGGNGRGLGGGPNAFTGGVPGGGRGGWWTPDRQKQAYEHLTAGGMPSESAIALVSRWANVESIKEGPASVNGIGAEGIAQWLGGRQIHNPDFHAQLDHVLEEYRTGSGDGRGVSASQALKNAKTAADAAVAASAYERAEGYNPSTGVDNFTNRTLAGMDAVRRNVTGTPVTVPPSLRHLTHLTTSWPGGRGAKDIFGKALIGMHGLHAVPLGAGGIHHHTSHLNMSPTNNISIVGVSDPTAAAGMVGARMDKSHASLLANVQSAIV